MTPWVSEDVLSLSQILSVCHWIVLSFMSPPPPILLLLLLLQSSNPAPPSLCRKRKTCLSKEREAHLNFRVFQHFVKVTPWVSENVLSPSQILSVCHWIVLSFSVHKGSFVLAGDSLSFSELNFSEFPIISGRSLRCARSRTSVHVSALLYRPLPSALVPEGHKTREKMK